MSPRQSGSQVSARRAELMAELFLQELEPQFLSRPTSEDVGYDLLVGFANKKGGINTFAVEVKATQRAPGARFPLPKRTFDRFAGSNIPGLLLVADVKATRMYYAWLTSKRDRGNATVSIPLTEVNDATKKQLQKQLEAARDDLAAVG
jgi:hypothetical protein